MGLGKATTYDPNEPMARAINDFLFRLSIGDSPQQAFQYATRDAETRGELHWPRELRVEVVAS